MQTTMFKKLLILYAQVILSDILTAKSCIKLYSFTNDYNIMQPLAVSQPFANTTKSASESLRIALPRQ